MPYLLYLHVTNASGDAWKEGKMDYSGVLMIIVLKCISLGVNVSDGCRTEKTPTPRTIYPHQVPSLWSALGYAALGHSTLVGPAVEYRDYADYIEGRGVFGPSSSSSSSSSSDWMPRLTRAASRLAFFFLYLMIYFKFGTLFSVHMLDGSILSINSSSSKLARAAYATFREKSFWYHQAYAYGYLTCTVVTQYFAMWSLQEVGFVLNGFAKRIKSDGKVVYDRFQNFDAPKLLLAESAAVMPQVGVRVRLGLGLG